MPGKSKRAKLKTELVISTTGSGWHFLLVPGDTAAKLGFEGKFKRVVCSINGSEGFQCALMPWGEIFYIIVNRTKRDKLGIVAGDMVSVELTKDESKYGLPMPEEFQEVLAQDPEGDRLLHALSEGKQRSLLYCVSKPKDIDERIRYSLIVVDHLKENPQLDGEQLYHALRRPV